ncbi:SWP7 [Hepatospora eriocheir]|uniref:SWP7 n=1 Tax=Hepatospora eriocheir TaxID=1081669 RepID=A0A1X0QJK5_9MICR|nr:SWP7 [Hepatospora eriocheir]
MDIIIIIIYISRLVSGVLLDNPKELLEHIKGQVKYVEDEFTGCSNENKTSIINFNIHVEREIAQALVSIAKFNNNISNEFFTSRGKDAEIEAIESYFSTIFDELNNDLIGFKVQVNHIINKNSTKEMTSNGAIDQSCEVLDAAQTRTEFAHKKNIEKNNKEVGINLYLFHCIYRSPAQKNSFVIEKEKCGRTIGILWDGAKHTSNYIKSAVIEAITGLPNAYETGKLRTLSKYKLCNFVEDCIYSTPSVFGHEIPQIVSLQRTKSNKSEDSSLESSSSDSK